MQQRMVDGLLARCLNNQGMTLGIEGLCTVRMCLAAAPWHACMDLLPEASVACCHACKCKYLQAGCLCHVLVRDCTYGLRWAVAALQLPLLKMRRTLLCAHAVMPVRHVPCFLDFPSFPLVRAYVFGASVCMICRACHQWPQHLAIPCTAYISCCLPAALHRFCRFHRRSRSHVHDEVLGLCWGCWLWGTGSISRIDCLFLDMEGAQAAESVDHGGCRFVS
jgi:hypothetical protein